MEIRQIQISESDEAAVLFDRYRMFYGKPSDPELARTWLRERLKNQESIVFGAWEPVREGVEPGAAAPGGGGGELVGFMQLYPCYSSLRVVKDWILNDLYVEPVYRGQGIGGLLIRKALAFAEELGAERVELVTGVSNFTAQRLYEKIGFMQPAPDTDFFTYRFNI